MSYPRDLDDYEADDLEAELDRRRRLSDAGRCWYCEQPLETHTCKHAEKPREGKPTVVCLCGSTRFREAYERAMREETLAGKIVLSVGLFGHAEGLDMGGPTKAMLDELHLRKIDMADEVLILNVSGYVGESTGRELEYARAHGKRVRFLEPAEAAS